MTRTIRKLVQFYTGHILDIKDQDIIGFKIFFYLSVYAVILSVT